MPRITDDLGIKKSLLEIHAERKSPIWNVAIQESTRQAFERRLGHVITQRELDKMLEALAMGEYIIRRKDDPYY